MNAVEKTKAIKLIFKMAKLAFTKGTFVVNTKIAKILVNFTQGSVDNPVSILDSIEKIITNNKLDDKEEYAQEIIKFVSSKEMIKIGQFNKNQTETAIKKSKLYKKYYKKL